VIDGMMEKLFKQMPKVFASDLHLSPGMPAKMRVRGVLKEIPGSTFSSEDIKKMIDSILSPAHKAAFEENWDLDFSYHLEGVGRYRSNIFVTRLGYGGVFRYISETIPKPEDLGLNDTVKEMMHHHQGMVLVTGPIRSGKTTTMASLIQMINQVESKHIITIEDPIEYLYPKSKCLINQREVGGHTKTTAAAMRAALREDPDIILVGEMRDLETMHLAIGAAETGHLVLSTMQTKSAHKTIDRIVDAFPPKQVSQIRTLLAGSLKGVVSQQLVPSADGKGMTLAAEILLSNLSLENLIRDGKTFQIPSVMQMGRAHGMQDLNEALLKLCREEKILPKDALRTSRDPKALRAEFKQQYIKVEA
jgi:twitching motility protein PilT